MSVGELKALVRDRKWVVLRLQGLDRQVAGRLVEITMLGVSCFALVMPVSHSGVCKVVSFREDQVASLFPIGDAALALKINLPPLTAWEPPTPRKGLN